jgi:hypothetical protein
MGRWCGPRPWVLLLWLLPAMSYYGSLAAAAAGGGALIALLLGSRRPVWSVVALTVGAIPGTVLLVQGGRALFGVLGIANGAAAVFFFVLAGLLVLPLVKLVLPTGSTISSAKSIMRQRGFLVPMGALALTVTLASIGIAVDRFDQTHPRQSHLMYVIDADSGTAMWVSHDQEPDAWTAAYVPNRNNSAEPHVPLPYDTTPRWQGPAAALPLKPPRAALLESRSAADGALVKVRVASSRAADVITVHVDRPVETAAMRPLVSHPSHHHRAIPATLARVRGRTNCVSTTVPRMGSFSRCSHAVSVFLVCKSVTSPLAWSRCPGSGQGPPVSIGHPTTAPTPWSSAVPFAHDHRTQRLQDPAMIKVRERRPAPDAAIGAAYFQRCSEIKH